MKKQIPNVLTIGRLVLSLVMFACLALYPNTADKAQAYNLALVAFLTFVVAAVTDFFDGWLARKWGVTSVTGAILDPIADKILVCAAILGVLGAGGGTPVLIPGAIILFREFAVSALREVLAPKGIKLPVTLLAKSKTTLQLVALGCFMALIVWFVVPGGSPDPQSWNAARLVTLLLFDAAAAVTVWTGLEYALAARKALAEAQ